MNTKMFFLNGARCELERVKMEKMDASNVSEQLGLYRP